MWKKIVAVSIALTLFVISLPPIQQVAYAEVIRQKTITLTASNCTGSRTRSAQYYNTCSSCHTSRYYTDWECSCGESGTYSYCPCCGDTPKSDPTYHSAYSSSEYNWYSKTNPKFTVYKLQVIANDGITYSISVTGATNKEWIRGGNTFTIDVTNRNIADDVEIQAICEWGSYNPSHTSGQTKKKSEASFTFNTYNDYCTVTLSLAQENQTISASLSSTSVGYGSTPPTLTVSGAQTSLSYVSSNTSVATIDSAGVISLKGLGSTTFTVTAAETSSYKSATTTVSLTVTKGSIMVKTSPTALTINYGQSLSASTLSGGSAINGAGSNVGGLWSWKSPTSVPASGKNSYVVVFVPTETTLYNY